MFVCRIVAFVASYTGGIRMRRYVMNWGVSTSSAEKIASAINLTKRLSLNLLVLLPSILDARKAGALTLRCY